LRTASYQGIDSVGDLLPPSAAGSGRAAPGQPPRHLTVRLLGPVRVHDGRCWVETGGTKQRTVLAALLLARSAGVSNRRLERLLWGEEPPETAHAQIQTYIYKLRKIAGLDRALVRQGTGYCLTLGPFDRFDLAEFERRAAAGRRALAEGRRSEAADTLREALALWRGPALADVTEQLQLIEQPRLEELHLAALEDRVEADLDSLPAGALVPELTGLVAEHPLRERLRGQLMVALHRCGRQADALQVYRSGRRLLVEASGLDPGRQLRLIQHRILADVPDADDDPDEPARAPEAAAERDEGGDPGPARPAQLPPEWLEPVGREKEAALAVDHLTGGSGSGQRGLVPVCAITGMVGVGKTMLAVHVARGLRDRYPDGQLYADLRGSTAHPSTVAEVLSGFLQALGPPAGPLPERTAELIALYRSKMADSRILVLLDDAADAAVVRSLLPSGAGCAAVVTCRTRLASPQGAAVVDLDVLELEQAVELLARCVGAARVDAEQRAAERIARACDGLPFAITVCGSRLAARPHWPLSRLADRLDDERHLLDELSFQGTAVRDRLLRACADLPGDALAAWCALSYLEVPRFSPWAVALLLGVPEPAAEDMVDRLVDERLLEVAASDGGPAVHYRFNGLLRAVARERAAREAFTAGRPPLGPLFACWLALAREAERRLAGERGTAPSAARTRRLPTGVDLDRLLPDPQAWFDRERPILVAAAAQARTEKRRVLASELAQVIGRLERACGLSALTRRPMAMHT